MTVEIADEPRGYVTTSFVDADIKDVTAERPKFTNVQVLSNLTKAFIGAASFELPWAVLQSGLWGGIVGILLLAIVSNYTIKLLPRCLHEVEAKCRPSSDGRVINSVKYDESLPLQTPASQEAKESQPLGLLDVGTHAFGTWGKALVYIGVISMNLGACSSYVVFVASNLSQIISRYESVFDVYLCAAMVFPLFLLLSWIRNYRWLSPTSIMGCIALVFAMATVYTYGAENQHFQKLSSYPALNIATYPLFFGNAAFLFCIHSVVLPIESEMKDRSAFPMIANVSMVFVTALNLSFAVICYLWWGPDTQGNIIENLPPGWIPDTVRIFLCIDLMFTYAVFMLPTAVMIESWFLAQPWWPFQSRDDRWINWHEEWSKNGIRAVLVITTTAVAVLVPEFSLLTNLVGGFSNNLISIVLPPLFWLKLRPREQLGYVEIGWCVLVAEIGILAGAATTVTTLIQIVKLF